MSKGVRKNKKKGVENKKAKEFNRYEKETLRLMKLTLITNLIMIVLMLKGLWS